MRMIQIVPYPYKIIEGNGYFPIPGYIPLTLDDFDNTEQFHWLNFIKDEKMVIGDNCDECYKLDIREDKVTITAPTAVGAFYGFITLLQLSHTYACKLPCMVIEDKPLHTYRGFMLDVARYYFPMQDIKKIVDLLALHKINKLHLHLTEDQGWRLEIKKYPLLATRGSQRSHTNFGMHKHGGFYTQNEIRDLISYCKRRGIEVIPEIDMPGHIQSAISCYPYLSCFDRQLPVATHWGVKHDILCMGKDTTYRFVYDVIDEVVELFDSQYIHIGGDEVPKTRTKLCPHCQAKINELGLENEDELQSYFMNQIATYISSKGKQAIMWNEYKPTGKCDKSLIWQVWNIKDNSQQIVDDINAGRMAIASNSESLYLDFPYGITSLKKAYNTLPEIDDIDDDKFLGVETCLWSEYVPNYKKAIFMTLPRLGAICENMWSPKGVRLWGNFLARMDGYYMFLQELGYQPAPLDRAIPNAFWNVVDNVWWAKRPLHWAGLHNLIDNMKVAKLAKQKEQQLAVLNKSAVENVMDEKIELQENAPDDNLEDNQEEHIE